MKTKLSHIQSRWHRLIISISIACLSFVAYHASPRALVHWLGRHCRPWRFERALFSALVFGAMPLFEPREYVLWSILWGGVISIFVTLHSIYLLIPRKRAHWVKL